MLFNLNPKTTVAVLALVALLVLGMAIPRCHGAEVTDAPYVQISGGSTVVRGPAPVLDLTFTEKSPQLRNAFFSESLTVIGTSTFRGQSVPNNFVLRGLFLDGFGRFDVGLGISWMQNPGPYNGSPFNANLQFDYRFRVLPITITYTHLSNAGSRLPNYGRDILLAGWRFR